MVSAALLPLAALFLAGFYPLCRACVDAEIERLERLIGRPMAAWRNSP